ncbi:hypothetical protein [Bradyrhizobium sp.]|uniref:hypothetical protein n=1 Tax=Bradyrhizobium sp. TaxID=376 RepID=UPI001ECFD573|nr:hypothetical protein [Bradyrhizobium sp.]MBV9981799.1 hypothetical protein [Bradyrhizobium sp.]
MTEPDYFESKRFPTTDGEIAVINLESARQRSWSRFFFDPLRNGLAEIVVEHEQLTAQFVGDVSALDRLQFLSGQLAETNKPTARTLLVQAQIASMGHRFAEARDFIAQAELAEAPPADMNRLRLNIDQACGVELDRVLDQRRDLANKSGRTEDFVALGALLADMRDFAGADRTYKEALTIYQDVSPFPVAWVCFQLGVLWGELVRDPQANRAMLWYQKAVDCLPGYTKARVHLAELHSSAGRMSDAEALLTPAVSSGDPEVHWRLADVMSCKGRFADAEVLMRAARLGFESLLGRHLLAFADHGAEFYAGSGNDSCRALDLAYINFANRPTRRAFEQAHAIAVRAGNVDAAATLQVEATQRWSADAVFHSSALKGRSETLEKGEIAS